MNTACLVVSRMSFIAAVLSSAALVMTDEHIFLVGVLAFAPLAIVFQAAYNSYRKNLRHMPDADLGLAEILEPDE